MQRLQFLQQKKSNLAIAETISPATMSASKMADLRRCLPGLSRFVIFLLNDDSLLTIGSFGSGRFAFGCLGRCVWLCFNCWAHRLILDSRLIFDSWLQAHRFSVSSMHPGSKTLTEEIWLMTRMFYIPWHVQLSQLAC